MMYILPIFFFSFAAASLAASLDDTTRSSCGSIDDTFTIDAFQLFPESAEWDPIHCRLWASACYNASEFIYNPFDKTSQTLALPGISGNRAYHTGGITFDSATRSMYLVADDANAFATNASGFTLADLNGPNRLLKYDLDEQKIVYDVSMSKIQAQVLAETGKQATGFQDVSLDRHGNAYVVGSFGSVIAKVTPNGKAASLWYRPHPYNTTAYGFTGIFTSGDKLVVSDTLSQGLVTFDLSSAEENQGVPTYITPNNLPAKYTMNPDGFHAPKKYQSHGRSVALMADNYGIGLNPNMTGGITVFGSLDNWATARYLGFVPSNYGITGKGAVTTSIVEIGRSIFLNTQYFQSERPLEKRRKFPFIDITEKVESIVREWESLE